MNLEIDKFEKIFNFPSVVYTHYRPDFLDLVKPVFNEYVETAKTLKNNNNDNVYPFVMTDGMSGDSRLIEFVKYISSISWDILDNQGYDMSHFYTDASEMWGQSHPFTSSIESHFHGAGSVLTGFYFLDTPENSCEMALLDPREVKIITDLPVKMNTKELLPAHSSVTFTPTPGSLIFTNSWLKHIFTRNKNILPYNFIHINIRVILKNAYLNLENNNNSEQPVIDSNEILSPNKISWSIDNNSDSNAVVI